MSTVALAQIIWVVAFPAMFLFTFGPAVMWGFVQITKAGAKKCEGLSKKQVIMCTIFFMLVEVVFYHAGADKLLDTSIGPFILCIACVALRISGPALITGAFASTLRVARHEQLFPASQLMELHVSGTSGGAQLLIQ